MNSFWSRRRVVLLMELNLFSSSILLCSGFVFLWELIFIEVQEIWACLYLCDNHSILSLWVWTVQVQRTRSQLWFFPPSFSRPDTQTHNGGNKPPFFTDWWKQKIRKHTQRSLLSSSSVVIWSYYNIILSCSEWNWFQTREGNWKPSLHFWVFIPFSPWYIGNWKHAGKVGRKRRVKRVRKVFILSATSAE